MSLRIYTWARMLTQSVHILAATQLGEPALLQSRLRVGARSAEVVLVELHRYGFVGPADRFGTRDVLITPDAVAHAVAVITANIPSPPTPAPPAATPTVDTTIGAGPLDRDPTGRPAASEQQHLLRPASAALIARMRALQQRASGGPTTEQ
jgi:hypothetical protein